MPVARKTAPSINEYMDEKPVKKRRYDEDEDEETTPRGRAADEDEDEDEEEEEDPDEMPARSSVIQQGWAAARKRIQEQADAFTDDFKFSEDDQIVKFLTTEPVIYSQHWLDNKKGKKSYVCLGEGCPLCDDLGDQPSLRFAFTVVNITLPKMPTQILAMGVKLAGQLETHHSSKRTGPLDRHFWNLSRTGTGRSTVHSVQCVKDRDLADDFEIDPEEVAKALAKREPLTNDEMVQKSTVSELEKVVDEVS
jgi:hypothetical protein